MKKRVLRVHPKIKSFIRGGYRYNPVIDKGLIEAHRGCRLECTQWIVNPDTQRRAIPSLISQRARHARIERRLRERLLKGV